MVFFVLAVLAELASLMAGWFVVHQVAKPLIMVSLIGLYFASSSMRSAVFVWALVFCWAGDVLLMFQDQHELFFMGGLIAFLTGHVLYIFSYRQFQWADAGEGLMNTQKVRYSFPIILAGTGLIAILYPKLGPLKVPVIIYALVLMVMVMTALFRFGKTSSKSFWLIFSGAILFMVSDSALALNKFYSPFVYSGLVIMLTYSSAQYLIVQGALHHQTGD
jgi:uncharacterized membrane protein YhhN